MMIGKKLQKGLLRLALCVSLPFSFYLSPFTLQAQDMHFSMLDLDPLLFNPAYAGFFDGIGRFGVVYRNQWASVSTPFQTLTATAEANIMHSTRNRNGLSGSLWLTNDRAGTLHYGSTTASAIVSFFQAVGNGDNLFSIALEGGMGQVGFDPEAIVLDDATESFLRTQTLYPTLGAGAAWFCQWNEELYTKAGFSMRNINEPSVSHLETADARLARKWNLYARAEWRGGPQWSLLPVAGYQHQARYSELVYGCDMRWYVSEHQRDYLVFSAGLLARHGDAAAVNIAVLWHEWTFAFSYDANLSRLAEASHTLGAFEIGILYMITRKDKTKRALPCPII